MKIITGKQVSVEGSSLDVFEGPDEGNTSEDPKRKRII